MHAWADHPTSTWLSRDVDRGRRGVRERDQSAVRDGEEVAWTGQGFRSGELVSLFWDGHYRAYVTTLPDGTWSVEWYDHQHAPPSEHNVRPRPGLHLVNAVGDRGDRAWCWLTVR